MLREIEVPVFDIAGFTQPPQEIASLALEPLL
jgi:hypothetical protein